MSTYHVLPSGKKEGAASLLVIRDLKVLIILKDWSIEIE